MWGEMLIKIQISHTNSAVMLIVQNRERPVGWHRAADPKKLKIKNFCTMFAAHKERAVFQSENVTVSFDLEPELSHEEGDRAAGSISTDTTNLSWTMDEIHIVTTAVEVLIRRTNLVDATFCNALKRLRAAREDYLRRERADLAADDARQAAKEME